MRAMFRLFSSVWSKRLATRGTALRAALCLLPLLAFVHGTAHAAFTMYLYESGSDVVASGGGSFDLSGATYLGTALGDQRIFPVNGMLYTGGSPSNNAVTKYSSTGPANFGPGANPVSANTRSGTFVTLFKTFFGVATGYLSGTPIASGAVFYSKTLSGLGVTCGTYVWTWGSGGNADSYTLKTCVAPLLPTVTAVSPAGGPSAGGASITITGTNLLGASAITVGGCRRASKNTQVCALKNDPGSTAARLRAARGQV